jgi:hypothetical protein
MSEAGSRKDDLERFVRRARAELRAWSDSAEHDPGTALIELFAYLGDTLTWYADRIADESYLGDARRRSAALRVEVDGHRWREVDTLADSAPDDGHYVVSLQDDGSIAVEFGDGVHGRRPSADSAVRVRYRPGRRFTSVLLQQGRVVIDADWNETQNEACGLYRATVVDNVDPLMLRRLRVRIPDVTGDDGVWAMACVPPGAADVQPSVGDPVWIAFESCDPTHPVWLGRVIAYPMTG